MQRFVRGGSVFLGEAWQVLRGEDTLLDQTLSQLHAVLVVAASGSRCGLFPGSGRGQVRIKPSSPLQGNAICADCLQTPSRQAERAEALAIIVRAVPASSALVTADR